VRLKFSLLISTLTLVTASPVAAQAPTRDPNLTTVPPQALKELSDDRVRQKIMAESQSRYAQRCVCPYQVEDSRHRSCKGRHEVIKTKPIPICYPAEVSDAMIKQWRQRHQ
jgi:hypothetical protein